MRRPSPFALRLPLLCRRIVVVVALVLSMCRALPAAADADPSVCAAAAADQERAQEIPDHLLASIAAVESAGRPFSVNADGVGHSFESEQDAIAFVQQAQSAGARYIDVGCFQIDLYFHPDAFGDLRQAFDPAANAAYAARFLNALHADAGNWDEAVGAYHSRDALRGSAYRALVYAANPAPWRLAASGQGAPRLWFGMRVAGPDDAAAEAPSGARLLPRVFVP